jgi:hypothetical protein
LADRVVRSIERELERVRCNLRGLWRSDSERADLGCDARLKLLQRGSRRWPIEGCAQPRQLFEKRVDGSA